MFVKLKHGKQFFYTCHVMYQARNAFRMTVYEKNCILISNRIKIITGQPHSHLKKTDKDRLLNCSFLKHLKDTVIMEMIGKIRRKS